MITLEPLSVFELAMLVTNLFLCAGVIFAALSYRDTQKKHVKYEEDQAFLQVDEAFVRANILMMEHVKLPLSYYHDTRSAKELTDDEKITCYLYFDILTSTLERVFVMFQDVSEEKYDDEWPGWDRYIGYQCQNKFYYAWWMEKNRGYGREFSKYLTGKMKEINAAQVEAAPAS